MLDSWRDEQYPIYAPDHVLYASIERAAAPLFGVVAYCVYLIVNTYVAVDAEGEGGDDKGKKKELRIWIPRRSRSKQTWPGMLDSTVAGAMSLGEDVWQCVVREAEEEASLDGTFVKENARLSETVSYFGISDEGKEKGSGEAELCQPECGFVFELQIEEDVVPKPRDGEVEMFYCWTVEEVKMALRKGEFKGNSAAVMVDWLGRKGLLYDNKEREEEYV